MLHKIISPLLVNSKSLLSFIGGVNLLFPISLRYFLSKKVYPKYQDFHKNQKIQCTRNGIKYELDLFQHLDHSIFFGLEEKSKNYIFNTVKSNFNCLDIGANIGEVSLNLAKICTEGKIYAFEPTKNTFDKLSKNIQLNQFKNISAHDFGLGRSEAEFPIHQFQEGNDGANRIIMNSETSQNKVLEIIKIKNLDSISSELPKIDLIKIDVEGFENEVIEGAINYIEKIKPILIIELIDKNLKVNGSSATELVNKLRNLNYKIYRIPDSLELNESFDFTNCLLDIACTQK